MNYTQRHWVGKGREEPLKHLRDGEILRESRNCKGHERARGVAEWCKIGKS